MDTLTSYKKTDMTANAVITNHESQMAPRLRRSAICRQYSKSGLSPYFLILSCPSDADTSVRASTHIYIDAIRGFRSKRSAGRGQLDAAPGTFLCTPRKGMWLLTQPRSGASVHSGAHFFNIGHCIFRGLKAGTSISDGPSSVSLGFQWFFHRFRIGLKGFFLL